MSTYEQFFGLQHAVFKTKTGGEFTFPSDAVRNACPIFKRAFAHANPVIVVSGPVGAGKSTAVKVGLNYLRTTLHLVHIGRHRLQADEVLDLLLNELGVEDPSGGTLRRIGLLKQTVNDLKSAGKRTVVIVEEASRTGVDIISELDVLCGDDAGADIALIICGDENIDTLFKDPALSRTRQRLDATVRINPMAVDELEQYLTAAVKQAGGDGAALFGKDVAGLLHILSCGLPRIANKLVEAALEQAASNKAERVDCGLLADVADSQFGLTTELPVRGRSSSAGTAQPRPAQAARAASSQKAPDAAPKAAPPVLEHTIEVEGGSTLTDVADELDDDIPELIQDTQPELRALQVDDAETQAGSGVARGINNPLPDLAELTAEFNAVSQMIEALPVDASGMYDLDEDNDEPASDDIPLLDDEPTTASEEPYPLDDEPTTAADEPCGLDDEPTTASDEGLDPDDMPTVADNTPAPAPAPAPAPTEATAPAPAAAQSAPAPIANEPPSPPVLDAEVELSLEATGQNPAIGSDDKPESEAVPPKAKNDTPDWDRDPTLAELRPDLDALELAMNEDVDLDAEPVAEVAPIEEPPAEPAPMPEITLDDSIAKKVEQSDSATPDSADIAEPPPDENVDGHGPSDTEVHQMLENLSKANSLEDMDDRLAETLFGDELNIAASQILKARESIEAKQPEPTMELSLEQTAETETMDEAAFEGSEAVELSSSPKPQQDSLDTSASQRLATLRALNAEISKPMPKAARSPKQKPSGPPPVPIEDQIDTSITATFKALKLDPSKFAEPQADADETGERKGFFSRFRKKG